MSNTHVGQHEYKADHCVYCGTKASWPLAKQPCPRAKAAINARESAKRQVLRKARLRDLEKANTNADVPSVPRLHRVGSGS